MNATLRRLPLRAGNSLPKSDFAEVRRRALLQHCKWDPQVGDQPTLAPLPVFIGKREWRALSSRAESH